MAVDEGGRKDTWGVRLRKTSFLLEGEAFWISKQGKKSLTMWSRRGWFFWVRRLSVRLGSQALPHANPPTSSHAISQSSVLSNHSLILHESSSQLGSSLDITVNNPQSMWVWSLLFAISAQSPQQNKSLFYHHNRRPLGFSMFFIWTLADWRFSDPLCKLLLTLEFVTPSQRPSMAPSIKKIK